MRKIITLLIFLFAVFFAEAQKSKKPAYYFTKTSEYYLTDAEVDSIFYDEATAFLKEQGIPGSMVQAVYPTIRNMLLSMGKQKITQAFTVLETQQKIKSVDKSQPKFYSNKQLYVEEIQAQIRNTFYANKSLSKYLSLYDNDRITRFNSIVRVGTDGKLLVQENISIYNGDGQVNALYSSQPETEQYETVNNEIKRGIVRAFPLYYINKYKLFQNTTFKIKSVLRNGEPEDYHTENHENGILVYTGSANIFLGPGNYTYTITYETDHQLKSLKDFDELYWNVTGNGWSFKIDSASCTVILPKGALPLSNKCYTGPQGATYDNCNFTTTTEGDSTIIVFKTTASLPSYNGFTIATSWPKGFVQNKLSAWQTIKYYVWNNKAVFFLPIAALFSAIFCFIFWFRYGRDPEKGTVYPLFEPPAGFGPAALGYIYYQKFSNQLTAAIMVDAAVRHKIKIDVERDGLIFKHNEYVISESKLPSKQPVSKYEEFSSDVRDLIGGRIEKGKYNSDLDDLNKTVQTYCEDNYKNKDGFIKTSKGFFALNNRYTTLPVLVCLVAAGWGFFGGLIKALQMSNFWQIAYFVGGIILCSLVFRIFLKLLTAYSPEGRKLVDKIEGFRMFLATADEKRFDMMSPPKKSLELYEKYLPFAIALDCENEWGQKFEEIINTATLDGKTTTSFSQSISSNSSSFSSSFASSFSGAISSATSPPSSSSGGGSSYSGGSSGGGGGGGGGGGW